MSVGGVPQWDRQLGCYVLEKHQDERRMDTLPLSYMGTTAISWRSQQRNVVLDYTVT